MAALGRMGIAILAIVLVGGLGVGGWKFHEATTAQRADLKALSLAEIELARQQQMNLQKDREIAKRDETIVKNAEIIDQQERTIEELDTAVMFYSVSRRGAMVYFDSKEDVVIVDTTEHTEPKWDVRVQLTLENGDPIGPEISGNVIGEQVYFDTAVIVWDFQHEKLSNEASQRRPALVLFRRIFGEGSAANQSDLVIDAEGMLPPVYLKDRPGRKLSDFEQKAINEMWELARNPDAMSQLGIKRIQGEAPSIKPKVGMAYIVELIDSGRVNWRAVNTRTGNRGS